MLAWADEGGGNLDEEIAVRRGLVADYPTFAHKRDYGRALERGYNSRARATSTAARWRPNHRDEDQALVTSYKRMRYRTSTERPPARVPLPIRRVGVAARRRA